MRICRFLIFGVVTIVVATVPFVDRKSDDPTSILDIPEMCWDLDVAHEQTCRSPHSYAACPASKVVRHPSVPLPNESRAELRKSVLADNGREQEARRLASEKNQVMDELLARPDIPSDYGQEMVALSRDRTQDVYTRDFAVQHIGLYAEALNRRGTYDPASREAGELRRALWNASDETGTIIAAAAFRALADLAAFDPRVDASKLESRLAICIGDAGASQASRVMALQICGERGVAASRQAVRRVLDDAASPVVLRKAAGYALRRLDGRGADR